MVGVQHQAGGSFVLLDKHCPICSAAVAWMSLGGKELEVLQEILATEVRLERTDSPEHA